MPRLGGRGQEGEDLKTEREKRAERRGPSLKRLNRHKRLDQPPPERASTGQVGSEQHEIVQSPLQ